MQWEEKKLNYGFGILIVIFSVCCVGFLTEITLVDK